MSEPNPPPPPPEPEALPSAKVAGVLIATLAIFSLSSAVVFWLERAWSHGRTAGPSAEVPDQAFAKKVNLLEQVPYSLVDETRRQRLAEHDRLSSYGWVDRARGIAHEPIDVAMDDLVREEGPK
jgi:hypothetical protein